MNNKITTEPDELKYTVYNLIWYRITHDEKYLESIPDIDSPDFNNWIYYIKYQIVDDYFSLIESVVYLNGKHYAFSQFPQFSKNVRLDEIEDSKVEAKIIEIGGEVYKGFELYNPNMVI